MSGTRVRDMKLILLGVIIEGKFHDQEHLKIFRMARGKLILICQSGGEFVKNDDGSLKYVGGEAQAMNVNCETLFDDLKLKLAEMWNLIYETVAIKYFLLGNTKTLITLSNDKDLKRMLDFHGNSVIADVFVTGIEGFNCEPLSIRYSLSLFLCLCV